MCEDSTDNVVNAGEIDTAWFPEDSDNLLKIVWRDLRNQNAKNIKRRRVDKVPFLSLSPRMVEMLFCVARRMNLSLEVQFLAAEVLDRCLVRELSVMRRHYGSQWGRALELVQRQFTLRVLCCLSIASKMEGHPGRILTPRLIVRYLNHSDRQVTLHGVCLAEQNILKTIDFQVPLWSPLTSTDTLSALCSLPPEVPRLLLRLAAPRLRAALASFADFASRISGGMLSETDLTSARCDWIMLSAAVVSLAKHLCEAPDVRATLVCSPTRTTAAAWTRDCVVSRLTGIPPQDIEGVAAALVHHVRLPDALLRAQERNIRATTLENGSIRRPLEELRGSRDSGNCRHKRSTPSQCRQLKRKHQTEDVAVCTEGYDSGLGTNRKIARPLTEKACLNVI